MWFYLCPKAELLVSHCSESCKEPVLKFVPLLFKLCTAGCRRRSTGPTACRGCGSAPRSRLRRRRALARPLANHRRPVPGLALHYPSEMARVVQVLTRQSLGLPPLPSTPVPAPVRKPGILGRAMSTPLPLHPGLAVPGPSTLSRRVLDTLEKIHEDRARTHPVPVESSGPTLPISGAVSLAQLSSSTDGRKQRRRLAQRVLGEKKLRAVEAKQKKAAKRRHLHTARLRASVGERSILETVDIGSDSQEDYAKRLLSFWGFAARWKISLSQPTQYDAAAVDWADFRYLDGEGPDHGERLRAALERWSISALRTGCLSLPRFKRVLKSWKKNHPKKSRLPMPEEFSWAITGWLGHVVGYESALYHACLFASYLRPGALLGLYATSVVPPTEELGVASHYVLVVSPFEKEVSTKTGYFD